MNKNTKLLFLHKLLYDIYFYGAITVPFFVSKGYGVSGALTFASAYMLISMAMEVPTGSVGDRYGHKVSIIAGALMIGVGVTGLVFFDNIIWDSMMIAIFATGGSLGSGSDIAMLKNISSNFEKDNRTFNYLKSVMLLLSFALAGFVVAAFGLNVAIGLTGLLAFICIVPLLLIPDIGHKKISVSMSQQVKEFPAAMRKIKAGKSIVLLGGMTGAVTFMLRR